MDKIIERHKHKIEYAGMQNAVVNNFKRIINDSCPDNEKLFAAEGIWAHQKLLNTRIKIESFLFCAECIYSSEAELLADMFLSRAESVYAVSKKSLKSSVKEISRMA